MGGSGERRAAAVKEERQWGKKGRGGEIRAAVYLTAQSLLFCQMVAMATDIYYATVSP